jgi:heme-degrading monooxygenase HmoA
VVLSDAMSKRDDARSKRPKYETVSLSDLRQGRLGKHHELVENILKQVKALPEGQAIKIPLDSVNGLSKANLRSALTRAASSRAMPVSTYSDRDHFYAWNRTKETAQYERKRKSRKGQR